MQLKHRFPLFFSFLFSVLLAVVMMTVYYLFADFRREEFKDRLAEKGESTVKLLLEVKEVDRQLLRIIDTNTINRLYNEKTLIFNDSMQIIYSSIDDLGIGWTPADIDAIKKKKEVFRSFDDGYDWLAMHYPFQNKDYYVFVQAEDRYGNRNLNYLKWILLGASIIGTLAIWFISFTLSKRTLRPLDSLRRQMQEITSRNLTLRVQEPRRDDEIKALSQSFNQMLDRIDQAYKGQKAFTSNASHELRTPLARIVTQLENLVQESSEEKQQHVLRSISDDAYQLSDIVTSLLILSKMEDSGEVGFFQTLRLDELVFNSASQLSRTYPDFKLNFEIDESAASHPGLEVKGDETLLRIVLLNLLKNAYSYSTNRVVHCSISRRNNELVLTLVNHGPVPQVDDTVQLFEAFTRGSNSANTPGSGIGLSIVRRILHHHKATMVYRLPSDYVNEVVVTFAPV